MTTNHSTHLVLPDLSYRHISRLYSQNRLMASIRQPGENRSPGDAGRRTAAGAVGGLFQPRPLHPPGRENRRGPGRLRAQRGRVGPPVRQPG